MDYYRILSCYMKMKRLVLLMDRENDLTEDFVDWVVHHCMSERRRRRRVIVSCDLNLDCSTVSDCSLIFLYIRIPQRKKSTRRSIKVASRDSFGIVKVLMDCGWNFQSSSQYQHCFANLQSACPFILLLLYCNVTNKNSGWIDSAVVLVDCN